MASRSIPRLGLLLLIVLAAAVPPARAQAPTAADEPPPLRFSVTGFEVGGTNPLDAATTQRLLAPFVGDYSGIEGLFEAAATLEAALAERGHSFHRVVLPPQTLTGGTVTFEVVAFTLGTVRVQGNEHFSAANIRRSLPALEPGRVPRTARISQQRYIANLHPSKQVEVRLKESERPREIDAVVSVRDSDPQDLFLVLDNSGNNETGDFRITGGFQHSNLSGHDDQLVVTTTVSPTQVDKVEQFGASYTLPLYGLGGRANAYYTQSDVDTGLVASVFDVAGAGRFVGASYTHFLKRRGSFTHQLTIGIDDKRFDNDVDFQGVPVGVNVRTRPVTISYNASYEHEAGVASGYVSYVRNWHAGQFNTKSNYAATRFEADPAWDLVRLGARADQRLWDDWLLRVRADAQLTGEPLVPGEQFGLGGARSVRGYAEREVSGDLGVFGSVELWSPPALGGARGIVFFDAGHRRNKSPLPGEQESDVLESVGVGVRWFWRDNLSLELDLARTLNDAGTNTGNEYKAHLNAFYRF